MNAERPEGTFAALLRQYRLAAGLTQEALAERARLSERGIADLERGVRRSPRPETVTMLAEALALSATERAAFMAAARRAPAPDRGRARVLSSAPLIAPVAPSDVPLVGRVRELALLERHLAGQGPPVLLLAGEPGIGKSRLLHEAELRAAGQGWRVLHGGCQRHGGQEPYAPLLQAIERQMQRLVSSELRTALQGCAWLVRLLPELADGPIPPLPGWTATVEQERRLMHGAVARFLDNVGGPAGTLLLLDDLQWAGPEAFALLGELVGRGDGARRRVIGTYRDTETTPDSPLSGWLADLARDGLATLRTLQPLAAEEAAHLLDDLMGDAEGAVRERVLGRSGGVPFFLVSCAQALKLDEDDAVPWDVRQSVRQRVVALAEEARAILEMAAVSGRVVPYALLATLAGDSEPAVSAALDAACRLRLLEEEPGAPAYRFSHDLIREVVEGDLGLARRTLLHRRIAEALETGSGEPAAEEVAFHYAQTPEHARAFHWLERAGDRAAAIYSMETALGHYRAARERLVAAGGVAEALAGLDEKVGAALMTLGRYDEARAVLDTAAETYRAAQDLEGVRRTLARIAEAYVNTWANAAGLARLVPLLEELESAQATPGLAALHVGLADLFSWSWMPKEQLESAARAEELARAVGEGRLLAAALERRTEALLKLDRLEEALPVALDACAVAEATGDIEQLWRALDDVARIHSALGDIAAGRPYFERALSAAEQSGSPFAIAVVLTQAGWIAAHYGGDWDRAVALWDRVVAVNRQVGPHGWSVPPALLLGHLTLLRGQREAGLRYLEEGLSLAIPLSGLWAPRWAGWIRAEQEIRDGDPAAARDRLVPLLDRPEAEEGEELQVAHLLPTLALAYLELDEVAQAAERAREAVRRLGAAAAHNSRAYPDERFRLVDALRVQALVLVRQEAVAEARATLEETLSLARGLPYPYGEACVLQAYGTLHVAVGEPQQAQEHLEAALVISRLLGARPNLEQIERQLADLGVPIV
jgi:tetratricopeptide (TPR) repeat protein/transcriptional regulator with XRE-family HTH domain